MKKTLIILLVLMLMLCFTGCRRKQNIKHDVPAIERHRIHKTIPKCSDDWCKL